MSQHKKSYYYYNQIKDSSPYFDLLHSELDKHLYYFGDHFKNPYNKNSTAKILLKTLIETALFIVNKFKYREIEERHVLTNCYFGFKNELRKVGLTGYSVPWEVRKQASTLTFLEYWQIQRFKIRLATRSFKELLDPSFHNEIPAIIELIKCNLVEHKILAVFLSNDTNFFERITISLAKKLNIKTFILMHGAAPRFANTEVDGRTDYLLVFGKAYQDKYIDSGFPKSRLLITGHPIYSNKKRPVHLRFTLDNILVISKTIPGQHLQIPEDAKGWDRDALQLSDRGNSILYLMMIQDTLLKVGVKRVMLRLHPSENIEWYAKHIDTEFFTFDNALLNDSLNKASLVIGPTSSTFIDALFLGVNYLIFEPLYENGLDILNQSVGYPFDGTEPRIPAANSQEELDSYIASRTTIDTAILDEFILPEFKLSEVVSIINR